MAAPTNVRVHAIDQGATRLKWAYPGVADIGIYRSINGSSYTLIATVDNLILTYDDEDLEDKTKYWYKLSDDVGVTFSSVVTVVTHLPRSGRQGHNARVTARRSRGTAVEPAEFNQVVEQLEADVLGQDVQSQPCDVCIVDQAIVLDCTSGCEWFRVIMDTDINSISLLGCDDCPQVDFIIPPGEERGICGWPQGCDFVGDECFEAVIPGGTNGRTAKTNGLSYDSYGPSPRLQTQKCRCPAASRSLAIKCCTPNCDLSCGEETEVVLKACGGLKPYTWSSTGNVSLNRTTGTSVIASRSDPEGSGFGGQSAWIQPVLRYRFYNSGACCAGGAGNPEGTWVIEDRGNNYSCDGTLLGNTCVGAGTYTITAPDACGLAGDDIVSGAGCSIFSASGANPCKADLNGTINTRLQHTPTTVGGQAYDDNIDLPPAGSAIATVDVTMDGYVDNRSQAQVDSGTCGPPCEAGAITVTVTDSVGVSVTMVLAS